MFCLGVFSLDIGIGVFCLDSGGLGVPCRDTGIDAGIFAAPLGDRPARPLEVEARASAPRDGGDGIITQRTGSALAGALGIG